MSQTEFQSYQRRRRQSGEPCECLRPLIRLFGILSAIVMCGVGVDIYLHGYRIGIPIIITSVVIGVLETKWIILRFLELLFNNATPSLCLAACHLCRYFGGWRLSFPYMFIGTALMMWPHNLWLSYVSGTLLIVLAALRLCTVFRFRNSTTDENLLGQYDFDKIENGGEVADERFIDIGRSLEDEEPIDDIA